jgi:protein SCO1
MRRGGTWLLAVSLLGGAAGCGSSSAGSGAGSHPGLQGLILRPAKPAPALALRNYTGQSVTLSSFRGKAVLVTFVYTHCPDVCPLMAANLGVALKMLGSRAARVQVIAVSVDPRGDTPSAVARFLNAHRMAGRMQYLIGTPRQLSRTWAAWNVGSMREVGQPDRVAHSALVYGVTAGGRLKTLYPSSFEPAELVHDVPRLAAG